MSAMESSTVISSGKVNHALKLLSNLENMKTRKIVCDFEIRVNGKSFSVHRAVLIACSEYFDGLFSSDMKEVRDGYIVMKGVSSEGTECCIEFMYTGEVRVTSSNVQTILGASHLMQLDDLIKICLQYLRDNINADTVLLTVKLFQLYGTNGDQTFADQYMISHFEEVIRTDMFPLINKEDLLRYLKASKLEPEVQWKAIVAWIEQNVKEKTQFLPRAVENLLKITDTSLTFLIGTLWKHPFVQNNDRAKALVLKALSRNEYTLEKNINLEICFTLKKIVKMHDFAKSDHFNKVLSKYMAKNFGQAIKKDEFCDLSLEDLTTILHSEYLDCKEESKKWEALLKWVKHVRSREKNLPDLMKLLNFEKIPSEYIHRNIRNESLVQKSVKCKDILLDAFYTRATPSSSQTVQAVSKNEPFKLVMLDEGSGVLTALDVEYGHHTVSTRVEKKDFLRIISVRGELYLFQNRALYKYSNTGTWEKRASLGIYPNTFSTQIVTFRDKIYMLDVDSMSCYDPSDNIWTEGLPICGLEGGFCVAASEYSIYALGGDGTCNEARRFDPESRRWFTMKSMRRRRECSAAVVYHEKLDVLGGWNGSRFTNSVVFYNRSYDRWEELGNMSRPRYYFSAVVYNDKLYAVGGELDMRGNRPEEDSIEVFNQVSNKWRIVHPLPKTQGTISACVCKSSVVQN